jgi:hypothetical protein
MMGMRRTRRPNRSFSRAALLLVPALLSLGCVRGCKSPLSPIHPNPNMDYQLKAEPQAESQFFYDGMTMRQPVPGTVARGGLREDETFYTGKDADGQYLTSIPVQVDQALLDRGEGRFAIYCQPCHDKRGLGQGILFQYGNVPTASFHDEQRRGYPDGQIFDVITNGVGLMQGYKWPISAGDRWAIVAHVNRLQEDRLAQQVALAGSTGR